MNRSILDRMKKARTALLLNQPFFGSLSMRLKLVAALVPTMATDGVSIFYNPKFVETLSGLELQGVFAHEVMHPALHHHTRRGNRDPKLWNEACDYVINPLLIQAGFTLPKGGLYEPKYAGMSAERVYNLLSQQQNSSPSPNGSGASGSGGSADEQSQGDGSNSQQDQPNPVESEGGFGQVLDAPNPDNPEAPMTEAQRSLEEAQWNAAVHEAEVAAKCRGTAPGGLDRLLKSAGDAKVDWRDRFRKDFAATLPTDYTWMRPNRRFVHMGLYLPGIQCEGVGELVVGLDCSGSIASRELGQFGTEINHLVEEHRPAKVRVLCFDEIVHREDVFACGEQVELTPKGGGGTRFEPVFEYIEENGIQPHALIFLTDLWGSFPKDEPPYPTLWVSTSPAVAPFGETIPIGAA